MKTAASILTPPASCRRGLLAVALSLCPLLKLPAQHPAPLQIDRDPVSLTLRASNDVALYYLLEASTNLNQANTTLQVRAYAP
jgi:hypothetical protein